MKISLQVISLLFVLANTAFSEEVWMFQYKGFPELLNNKRVSMPTGTVALSHYITVGNPSSSEDKSGVASIFFIIDNSGSMKNMGQATDAQGSRFTVTAALLDSIYLKNPKSEVGVAVFGGKLWYQLPRDTLLFKQISTPTGISGYYIPLITLDSMYGPPINKKGIDILKISLRTRTQNQTVDLEINDRVQTSTNINCGFMAAKDAFAKAKYPNKKENHYIIFYSDGEANDIDVGVEPDTFAYVKGTNTPTTFTVYFTSDTSKAFANLQTMTNNIKGNGYSKSNPTSNLWSIKTDFNTLLQLMMKNVITPIFKVKTGFLPKTISINGINAPGEWDSTGFTFKKFFPLTGRETPISMSITYQVSVDSILPNGQTVNISKKDTTHSIKFTVEVSDTGSTTPAPMKLTKWDRTLAFGYKGQPITEYKESMKNIDINFAEKKVDTLYGYKNIDANLTNDKDNPADLEKYRLNSAGNNQYTYTFARTFGTPNPGNTILEHSAQGNIVAIFRNPDLPLDTLRKAIPLNTDELTLTGGIYFDNDANGKLDSIFIKTSREDLTSCVADLKNVLDTLLPKFRKLTITEAVARPFGVGLKVKEGAPETRTYITSDDRIVVDNQIAVNGATILMPCSFTFIDSMAPVAMGATYCDSTIIQGGDTVNHFRTLWVTLSENITKVTDVRPFKYYNKAANKEFTATLKNIVQSGTQFQADIDAFENGMNRIVAGDSLRINADIATKVQDNQGALQDNSQNIRREIVVRTPVKKLNKPFDLVLKTTILDPDKEYSIDQAILNVPVVAEVLKKLPDPKTKGISFIVLEPKQTLNPAELDYEQVSATFSIYDAVGNVILSNVKMGYYAKNKVFNKMIFLWDGKNQKGRSTGPGVYKVIAHAELMTPEKTAFSKQELIGFVGVKRK